MERNNFIDYAKAVSIAFIVFIHIGFNRLNGIVLFAMPVFFAATGYTYTLNKRSIKDAVRVRFRSIMLPFWYMMLFYTVLEMVRAYLFGYGTALVALPSMVNAAYGSGAVPFNGGIFDSLKEIMSYKAQPASGVDLILPSNCHLWFLPAMFTGYVIFILLAKKTLTKHWVKPLVILLLLALSASESVIPYLNQLPYGLGRGAAGAAFMLVGFWIKEYKLQEKKNVGYYVITCASALVIYISAILLGSDGSMFVRSVYGPYGVWSVIITFAGGTAGIWLLFCICRAIEHVPSEKIRNFLSFTGRNVMTVYLWHMAVKFVLDVIYIFCIKGYALNLLDEYKMGLIPKNSFVYMIFEALVTICVCLYAAKLRNKRNLAIQPMSAENGEVFTGGYKEND